jgi:hypothetical protein
MGILWSPRVIGRGFRLKARMFRLATIPHPRRAQTPSRSLLLSVHAGRSRFRGALSTKALSLPPGALWLVLPLHDDRPRIAVPLTTAPERILKVGNSRWAASLSILALRFRRLLLPRNTRSAPEVASGRSRFPSRRPMQPGPDPWCRLVLPHLEHAAGRLDPSPYAPPGDKALASVASAKWIEMASLSTPRVSPRRYDPTARAAIRVEPSGHL